MDPMSAAEEERRQKEHADFKDLCETISLDNFYFTSRDLLGKGKDVHPTGKQRKIVQTIAQSLKFPTVKKSSAMGPLGLITISSVEEDSGVAFNLMDKQRIFINSGPISRAEPGM